MATECWKRSVSAIWLLYATRSPLWPLYMYAGRVGPTTVYGYCMLERVVGSKMASVCREGLVGYV